MGQTSRVDALKQAILKAKAFKFDLNEAVMASDAFFPFRDNIDQASKRGVNYIVQPGSSNRDKEVISATDEYGMVMFFSGIRLFHH